MAQNKRIKDIDEVQRNILVLHYRFKIKDEELKKAFINAVPHLKSNRDIAELANGLINGTITL